MLRMILLMSVFLSFCFPPMGTAYAEKTQVIIIGTVHSFHNENAKYSPDILREIILSIKPDAILNELPLSLVDADGRPMASIRGKDNPGGPESWAADSVATQLGIKQIPFDRPDRQENFKKTNYFEKAKKAAELRKKWISEIESNPSSKLDIEFIRVMDFNETAELEVAMSSGPEVINSDILDSISRTKHCLWHDIQPIILEKYPAYTNLIENCLFEKKEWIDRNRIMVENIIGAAKEYPGKRLVIITGATHRYILRDLLQKHSFIDLKEYWELAKSDKGQTHTGGPKTGD